MGTFIIWEIILHWAYSQLFLEAVDLVQKQDDTRLCEPSGIANAIEKSECLLHTIDRFVLEKELVIFRDGNQEENGGDVLEAVYPFLSF